ncbi:hypothetical protein ACLKA7_016901 [Drosophila subpalustris]
MYSEARTFGQETETKILRKTTTTRTTATAKWVQSKKSEDELQARKAPLQHWAADEACATGKAKITAQQTTLMSNSDNGQQDERGPRQELGDGEMDNGRETGGHSDVLTTSHAGIQQFEKSSAQWLK